MRSKKKRTFSPEYTCTKLFTSLTMTLFPKPACVYSTRQSPGVKKLLGPAAILPKLYPNHYEMSLKKIRKSEEEKLINFVKLGNITLKID